MIGVGGIGTGSFFALSGNHTVGREESRSGHFIDRRDYCKLHIVSHYVKALLGRDFTVLPVGAVGDDEQGKRLLREMEEAGLDLRYVEKTGGAPTLYSFCFVYPDGSGGNFTTDDSACARITPDFVSRAEEALRRFRGGGIALAVPEVPLAARLRLLELGTEHGLYRAASFNSKEVGEILNPRVLGKVDLLALNIDEAAMVAEAAGAVKKAGAGGSSGSGGAVKSLRTVRSTRRVRSQKSVKPPSAVKSRRAVRPAVIAESAVLALAGENPELKISITCGGRGSWVWNGQRISHFPATDIEAVSTAGAGDAFLAGLLVGITAGLSLTESQELATLVAALSATSPHTIHKGIDRASLARFAKDTGAVLADPVRGLLFSS
jgi:sugar/nucleoside kinase (ribokinase family)